uniref:Peptidase S8/S53 domain-containing protein n=1 Tax=Tetradesmus obliquus TaxID=3088 RepID=A0A383V483_TETOB|eukprot:jgi/Sobl393_1/14953/SZX60415.1
MRRAAAAVLVVWMLLCFSKPGQPGVAAAEEPQTLLARVHSDDCVTTQRVSAARVAGGASPVVGLAAVTASSVKAAAAAVGLKFIEELPFTCWLVLGGAETKEATAAAVKALLAGSDDGIDPTHNDLKNQMDRVNSVTYCRGTGNQPPGGVEAKNAAHGSHVSGTAAGDWGGGDTRGIAGIAGPMKGQLVSCNVFGSSNGATDSDIGKCLAYAVSTKSHWAINLSLGGVGSISDDEFYQDAFKDFCNAGGIALIAAGNGETVNGQDRAVDVANAGDAQDGTEAEYPAYMANYYPDCVIAIANIQEGDRLAPSSNYGRLVKLAAPGTDITSDVNSNGGGWAYDTWDGTSMATPHATGSVILLRNAFPQASAKQVVSCLVSSADKTVTPNRYGTIPGGVLNLLASYNCMKAIFGDPTGGGGGGGTTPVDCTAQSVPECVLASSGVAATAPCSTSTTTYCLAVGTITCSYSYRGSGTTCSNGKCSGSAADCSAGPPPAVDCTARMLPICVDTASGAASSSPCRTTESIYCELANSNTYCSYKYLGRSATCGTDGSRCSGSAPNCPAAPTDCSALMLPLCVNRRTGFFSTTPCKTTSTSYCERVSSSAYCSYSYLGSSTTCGTDGTKCNGQSADCPWGSGGGGSDAYCSDPPMVDGATWDESCATLSMPGDTCEATCDSSYDLYNGYDWGYDYGTVGYSIECNADGTWGEVQTVGDACGTNGGGGGDSSSVCSDCSANDLCSEDDGCICEAVSNGEACTCAEDIGFTQIDYTPDGSTQTKSYCGWALNFAASAYRVNRNTARSRLDFTVGPSDLPMCVSDNDNIPEVVDSVEFVTDTYDCPTGLTFVPLPASQRQLNVELCNRRTKLTSLIFEASSARRSARQASGKCRDMIVHTTDYMSYTIPVRIMN